MRVDNFTQNEHEITAQLGAVANRHYNRRWDCRTRKLALATEAYSQRSTRMPHGLLIDNASTSDFIRSSKELMLKLISSQLGLTNYDDYGINFKSKQ